MPKIELGELLDADSWVQSAPYRREKWRHLQGRARHQPCDRETTLLLTTTGNAAIGNQSVGVNQISGNCQSV